MFGLTFLSATSKTTTHRVVPFSFGQTMGNPVGGYVAGGNAALVAGIDKIAFPADTKTTLVATLTSVRAFGAGFANSAIAGYSAAGRDNSGKFSNIDKIAFPADTKTTLSSTLTTARDEPAASLILAQQVMLLADLTQVLSAASKR